jgi:hypothetical protein
VRAVDAERPAYGVIEEPDSVRLLHAISMPAARQRRLL